MHLPPAWLFPSDGPPNRPPGGRPRPRLWLVAGTGEGPVLARSLLDRGWRLRVSVVTAGAARAYEPHPDLELAVGPLGMASGEDPQEVIARDLALARRCGDPFHAVVDASHPFAIRISAALAGACAGRAEPLLRLERPVLPLDRAVVVDEIQALRGLCRPGERLLLAIGARRMAEVIAATPEVVHHGRVLPSPESLRAARAAGLAAERLACLRPGPRSQAIEAALCRRWTIDTVLCRQSGGESEGRWHRISAQLGLRLLLLRRPPEPAGVCALPLDDLLGRVAAPPVA
ncbi:MAG: precorrin-6A/cobalt-precorrin-6A reductase [Cyanobium sp.]